MQQMLKHTGKVVNTDARCVVVYMQLPEEPDSALIINMDVCPPHFERPIRSVLESAEGQSSANFYEILHRRLMPDTGLPILTALFNAGLLQKAHIDQIVMCPRPSMHFPLREVIAAMKGSEAKLPEQKDFAAEKFNPHLHNQKVRSQEDRINLAKNILMEAEELNRTAAAKAAKAYDLAPELRPARAVEPAQVPMYTPPPRMPVVDVDMDVAGPAEDLGDVAEPETNAIDVHTETADSQTIESYADMMMKQGDTPLIDQVPGREEPKKGRSKK